ncbi:MAG: type II toxin-antitoxin system VapC family toxin [Xanthomonadales bacterium]|nr:type II toxin-antitoxin system VapC family toxin [Xanthomonadales bacterium]
MRVLLDTCVLSEIRHPRGAPRVRTAVQEHADEELFLSVLTLGELAKGIALLKPGRRKRELEAWLSGLHAHYSDRILTIDSETSLIWGEITAAAQPIGRTIPAIDGLIAATALRHGLALMTRNVEDFTPTGVRIINPWAPPGVHDA